MSACIENLTVVAVDGRTVLDKACCTVLPGKITALTGASGSGKTTLLRTILGDLAPGFTRVSGTVEVLGQDPFLLPAKQRQRFRRSHLAFVGQDPGAALNPLMRVEALLTELGGRERLESVLDRVRLRPEHLRRRPHELSGGEQRRVALARALMRRTEVLVVDEPLAGLDVQLRRDIAELLRRLAHEDGVAIAVSGHDTEMLTDMADDSVDLGGSVTEVTPPPADLSPTGEVIVRARELRASVRRVPLLQEVDLTVRASSVTGVLGASGAGKTTLARVLAGLHRDCTGSLELNGQELPFYAPLRVRLQRQQIQLVPQDPLSTLNPNRTVGTTLARPLDLHRIGARHERPSRVAALLSEVGLPPEAAARYPRELSGGQRQRVAIARALAAQPGLLICDEITSALDEQTGTAIMHLLDDLRRSRDLALLVISHDLRLVRRYCSEVLVLDAGQVVEAGATADVFGSPTHAVTAALLDGVPGSA